MVGASDSSVMPDAAPPSSCACQPEMSSPAPRERRSGARPRARLCLQRVLGIGCKLLGMNRGDLSEEQWERLSPLLPPQKPKTGRPARDHRQVLNGILWILRTGAPWRDLPERYGPWKTVATRFYRWRRAGVFDRLLAEVQAIADEQGKVNWEVHYVDGTIVRAHQHAAGAKRGTRRKRRLVGARVDSGRRSTSERTGTAA
jgi:transposase